MQRQGPHLVEVRALPCDEMRQAGAVVNRR